MSFPFNGTYKTPALVSYTASTAYRLYVVPAWGTQTNVLMLGLARGMVRGAYPVAED